MRKDHGGFTLIEVLVGMAILIVGILGTASLINAIVKYNEINQRRLVAQKVLEGELSGLRSMYFVNFTISNLRSRYGFSDSVPSGYPVSASVLSSCPPQYDYRLYKTATVSKSVGASVVSYRYTMKLCVDDDYLPPYLKKAFLEIYWSYMGRFHTARVDFFIPRRSP